MPVTNNNNSDSLKNTKASASHLSDFYKKVLTELLQSKKINLKDSVLVICAGEFDIQTLTELGFEKVTITNLSDTPPNCPNPNNYSWQKQNAEQLDIPDASYDIAIVHSGLHHCRSPHRALLEMYRVARKAIIGFEPHYTLLINLGAKLGIGQIYETAAVRGNNYTHGGVCNSSIPNLVYRLNRREITNTILTNAPEAQHETLFWHTTRAPRSFPRLHPIFEKIMLAISGTITLISHFLPIFANNIAFYIKKPSLPKDIHPWLLVTADGTIGPNQTYIEKIYNNSKTNNQPND